MAVLSPFQKTDNKLIERCPVFISFPSVPARPVSIKNFASLCGLAKFFFAIGIAKQSGRKYLSKIRDTQKGTTIKLKTLANPPQVFAKHAPEIRERNQKPTREKKHWKKFTRENRLQNSSKCVLVNFCTSCLDRLLIEYYNFKTFLYHVLKVFTPTLTSVHSHVYKYIVVSLSQDKIFEFPHFV